MMTIVLGLNVGMALLGFSAAVTLAVMARQQADGALRRSGYQYAVICALIGAINLGCAWRLG